MTATGISPKKRRMVFLMSTLLQHDFILAVQNKKQKSTMQSAFHVPLILASIQF
jgi:hypothetical protein